MEAEDYLKSRGLKSVDYVGSSTNLKEVDLIELIENYADHKTEHLHQRVKELECVGFKMLSSIGNYMNDSRSGATYVFDYHSPSLDSGDLCSQPAWIDSETGDVLDPSEAFEIYRFEAQELLTKDKE